MSSGGFGGEMNRSAPTPARAAVTMAAPGELVELPKPPGPNAIPQCELTRKILDYDPKADTCLIDAAYDLAAKAHGTQRRENGDPYFTHPVAVADILAGYRLDVASIATALLHDVVEDTPTKLHDI
jgi:GTP diphosphokinase / guanosine-3',5'-bis(diphosphate) 3'-diphosphatase